MPNETATPYPINCCMGAKTIAIKAAIVVRLVKNIGSNNESIVIDNDSLTSLVIRIFLKNLVRKCTPSAFAMVSSTIGIDVLSIENRNLSDPVNLYIHPINPSIATNEDRITIKFIITAGALRKLKNKINIIIIRPMRIKKFISALIIPGKDPIK